MNRNIIIVKLGAIGDVANALPAAWRLQQAGSTIHWLCGSAVAPLLACYSWVRPIVIDDRILSGRLSPRVICQLLAAWLEMTKLSYDLCATLQFDRRYSLLTLPITARRSLTLDHGSRKLNLVSERHHSAEFNRILCDLPDDYRATNVVPITPDRLPENPLPRGVKRRVALAPGGARNAMRDDPLRRWPSTAYVSLASQLIDSGVEVVLTGGQSDRWVEPDFRALPVHNAIGQWTLPQLLAFYQSCHCVVTHDSGSLHVAGLMDCGLVGLFGPTAPSKALPRRNGAIGLWGGEQLPCRPCYDGRAFAACGRNDCMIAITPQHVMSAVMSLIEQPHSDWRVEHL